MRFVLHNSLWGYLIAVAIGGMSQFVKDAFPNQPWLGPALLYLTLLIALLATLGVMHEQGWLKRAANLLRRWLLRAPRERIDSAADAPFRKPQPRVREPRPAGPAGPVPVLRTEPKMAPADDVAAGNPGAPSQQTPPTPAKHSSSK